MIVWLVTIGEPLPTDGVHVRLLRAGILAKELVNAGHEVVWWTSTFDHTSKKQRSESSSVIQINDNYRIRLLHGRSYKNNVSIDRVANHREVAAAFRISADEEARPGVILSSYPTLELCKASVDFGKQHGVPVAIDIRDLWPDVFVDLFPRMLRPLGYWLIRILRARVASTFQDADAFVGNSPGFVSWAQTLAGRGARDADKVFPFGYSTEPVEEKLLGEARKFWAGFGIHDEENTLVTCFFGTLGRQFDIETVIKAAQLLEREERPFRFVLCGTGDRFEDFKRQAAGCKSIVFPGWVGQAEIRTLMGMSRAGLAPYFSGVGFTANMPNKPIEYLSAGLPVVSSLKGHLETVLSAHNCGRTYANGDSAGLADILRDLYDNSAETEVMSRNARSLFQAEFAAGKIYPRFVEYLESLAAGERGSSMSGSN